MSRINEVKESSFRKFLNKRDESSHKGDNGRLLIIGGSLDYYGAPILAAKAAMRAGVDLVYLYVPECNYEVTRAACPDFIVRKYEGEFFSKKAAADVLDFGKMCNAVLIGPGFGYEESSVNAVLDVLNTLHLPTVLDSSAIFALKKVKKFPLEQELVATPHQNEFRNLVDRDMVISEDDTQSIILLRSIAMDLHFSVILKGKSDLISSEEGDVVKNLTGVSGMTVGGTGDVLAGVCASLMAQGNPAFISSQAAAYYTGIAGEKAFKKYGNGLMASDVAEMVRV